MADASRTVRTRFSGDASGLERAAGRGERALHGLDRAAGRSGRGFVTASVGVGRFRAGLGATLGGIARAVPIAGALTIGVGALALKTTDAAVNLGAMDQKARTVFGTSFPQMERWAGRVNDRMGLTNRQVLAMAAGFSDMLVPMGFARDRAAGLGKRFAELAPILSEWSAGQLSVTDAAQTLTGALTGEYDSLQALGIPISAAAVQAELLKRGQDKLTGSARSQAEAIAALDLVYRGSTDAQKSYASGANKLAIESNKAKARLSELKEQLIVKVTPWLTTAFEWFNTHWPEIGLGMVTVGRVGAGLATSLAGVAAAGLYTASALTFLASGVAFLFGQFDKSDQLRGIAKGLSDSAGKAIEFGNAIQSKTNPMLDRMQTELNAAKAAADRLPKSKVIFTSAPGARRSAEEINTVRFQAGRLPASKRVNIDVRTNAAAAVAVVRAQLNSIKDRVTYHTTVLRTVRALQPNPAGGYQHGTPLAARGWRWVGEGGPELAWFGSGGKVLPADLSTRLAGFLGGDQAGAGGGGTVVVELVSRDPLLQALLALVDARIGQRSAADARRFRARAGVR